MATICLVNGVFPPHVNGGAENYILRTATELQERGHDVSILTTKPYDGSNSLSPNHDVYKGIPIYRFYPLNLSHRSEGTGDSLPIKAVWHQLDTINPHAKRTIDNILKDLEPDIVHTNNFMGISSAIGSSIEKSDARYVHMLHDYSLMCPKSNLMRERTLPDDEVGVCHDPPLPCQMYSKAKKKSMGVPDQVIAPSEHVIDIHKKHGFFNDIPTRRIQHGVVDVASEPPESTDEKSILYAGKHQRSKGLETLYEAAEQLQDVTIHLCGSGPLDEKSEKISNKLNNVRYHGFVSESHLHKLRKNVDATVLPSIWMENSPLVIYESFAMGIPVIGSDIGGIPELVEPGIRGSLFQPEEVQELVDSVYDIVDSEITHSLSKNSLEWANNHTLEHHVDQLIESYQIH